MFKKKEKQKGFSPTLHLIKTLCTTLRGSMPQIDKCTAHDLTAICNKQRYENIHICVDIVDDSIILAVCNAQENCARSTMIHPYKGCKAPKIAEEVVRVLKRSSLGAQVELGVSGGCQKTLQTAQSLTHISRLKKVKLIKPSIVRRPNIVPKKEAPSNNPDGLAINWTGAFSRRFADPIHMDDKQLEIYEALHQIRDKSSVHVQPEGIFTLKDWSKKLDDMKPTQKNWWYPAFRLLCRVPAIIDEKVNHEIVVHVVRVHNPHSSDSLSQKRNSPNPHPDQETRNMTDTKYSPIPNGVKLTNKEKEMLRELLKLADDKLSTTVKIADFTKKLVKSPYSSSKPSAISVLATGLRKKGLALPADKTQKGVLEILRLHPDELKAKKAGAAGKPATSKKASDAPSESSGEGKNLATTQEKLEDCSQKGSDKEGCCGRHHGKDSFCDQMIAIMDKVDDLEALSDELLSNLDKKKLRILHTLLSLADKIRDNEDCPEFEEVDDRTKVSFMLD